MRGIASRLKRLEAEAGATEPGFYVIEMRGEHSEDEMLEKLGINHNDGDVYVFINPYPGFDKCLPGEPRLLHGPGVQAIDFIGE